MGYAWWRLNEKRREIVHKDVNERTQEYKRKGEFRGHSKSSPESHTIRRLYPHCSEDERADLGTRLGNAGDIGKHHHHVFSEVETEAVALKEDPRGK